MDLLQRLNDAVAYIESCLCDEINMDKLAQIACITKDSFIRFFSYMTGMTLKEYIRRRRLTLAAYDLRNSDIKVIDVAVKYGYDSADAFTKAFIKQHGITPTESRNLCAVLKIYPPASFHILIKGAKEMDFKIIETDAIKLRGLSKQFTGSADDKYEQEHIMWGVEYEEYMRPVNPEIPGIWYGIWNNGLYTIAKAENETIVENTNLLEIPAGTYAVFTTGFGKFAGDALPPLRELIFDSWLPDSGYIQTDDYEIEVYHLYPKDEKRRRYYEMWIPVGRRIYASGIPDAPRVL